MFLNALKVSLTLLILFILSTPLYFLQAAPHCGYSDSLNHYKNNRFDQAIKCIHQGQQSRDEQARSQVLLAQIYYQQQDWSRFFGVVQFLRFKKELQHELTSIERDTLSALEILALGKKCRISDILNVQDWLSNQQDQHPLSERALKLQKVSLLKTESDPNIKKQNPLSEWSINAQKISQLSSPRNLKIEVRSECE